MQLNAWYETYFMNGNLKVVVNSIDGKEATIDFCFKKEKCGEYPYYIEGNWFFNDLITWWADYDAAEALESAVTKYCETALEQFNEQNHLNASIIKTFHKASANHHTRLGRVTVWASDRPITITTGISWDDLWPTITDYRTTEAYCSHGEYITYLTADEYETMKSEWRLEQWKLYIVMS